MSARDTVRMLRDGVIIDDPEEWRRVRARVGWALDRIAALRDAQRQMNERCTEAVGRLEGAAFDRLVETEQAKVGAVRAELDVVIERDVWPRHLYFGGI